MVFSDSDGEEAPPQNVIRIPYGESPGVWCRKDPDKFLDWQVVNLDQDGKEVEIQKEDKITLYNACFPSVLEKLQAMLKSVPKSEPSFYGNLPPPPFEDLWKFNAWSKLFKHRKLENATSDGGTCPVCYETSTPEAKVTLDCHPSHWACATCVDTHVQSSSHCFLCKAQIVYWQRGAGTPFVESGLSEYQNYPAGNPEMGFGDEDDEDGDMMDDSTDAAALFENEPGQPCRFGLFANDDYNPLRVCGGTDTFPQLYVAHTSGVDLFMIGSAFHPQRTLAMLQESSPFRIRLVATFDISDVTGDVVAMHGAETHVHMQLRDYGGPFHDPPGIMEGGSELGYKFPATHSEEHVASLVGESLAAFRNANAN